jgi:ankyrin repeat protein
MTGISNFFKKFQGRKLLEAAEYGDAAEVSTLLSTPGAQCFINSQGTAGRTALHLAAGKGHEAVTEQLLAALCNVNLQAKNGGTVLHLAAAKGLIAVTDQLIAGRGEAPGSSL